MHARPATARSLMTTMTLTLALTLTPGCAEPGDAPLTPIPDVGPVEGHDLLLLLPVEPSSLTTHETVHAETEAPLASEPVDEDLFDEPPIIFDARTDVGFAPSLDDVVYSQALMRYKSNRARQRTILKLDFQGRRLAEVSGLEERTHFFPRTHSLTTNAAARYRGDCGHYARGDSQHEAWHELLKPKVTGDIVTSWNDARQGDCPQEFIDDEVVTESSSGGDEGWGDESDIDTMYLCWFLVRIDQNGTEISRELIRCEPV